MLKRLRNVGLSRCGGWWSIFLETHATRWGMQRQSFRYTHHLPEPLACHRHFLELEFYTTKQPHNNYERPFNSAVFCSASPPASQALLPVGGALASLALSIRLRIAVRQHCEWFTLEYKQPWSEMQGMPSQNRTVAGMLCLLPEWQS